MTVDSPGLPVRPRRAASPTSRLRSRLFGLGSVFGKTLRDSRLGVLVVAGAPRRDDRRRRHDDGDDLRDARGPARARGDVRRPCRRCCAGMYGNPVNVDTLGGFISWHYGAYFALLAGLWSILALSSTLAGEARRGSLDFTVATPRSKRSIALEKIAATSQALARCDDDPGDRRVGDRRRGLDPARRCHRAGRRGLVRARPRDQGARRRLDRLRARPVPRSRRRRRHRRRRDARAGTSIQSYRTVVPAFDTLAGATWFSWTAGHVPLAGQSDWAGIAVTAVVCVVLLGDRRRRRSPGATSG